MATVVLIVFCLVYLGIILGGLPFLSLDRTGIALLGAITLLAVRDLTLQDAAAPHGFALDCAGTRAPGCR